LRHHRALEVMDAKPPGTTCHVAIEIEEASQVGEARRAATALALALGFDSVATGRVALVATELGTNLVKHARRGRLLLAAVRNPDDGEARVEMISIDHGPGIDSLPVSVADGYSTSGTAGNGLGAVRRLCVAFDAYSSLAGTILWVQLSLRKPLDTGAAPAAPAAGRGASGIEVGAVALAAPGETECGDGWTVAHDGQRAAVLVADGLGHGPLAAEASQAALRVFLDAPWGSPSQVLERVHRGLSGTRGAAVAMAQLDRSTSEIAFGGVGNIAARLISGVGERSLVSQHGTAGVAVRRLQDSRCEWPEHAMLVLHSDGLATRWDLAQAPGLLQHHPTLIAAWLVRDHVRGRDDVTVVILQRKGL
jgi:anti-sigma regulatory factor (Ser/Thr protein kinase)